MEWGKLFVDLIGYLVWPTLILFVIWFFREQVRPMLTAVTGLAGRVTKVGPAEFQGAVAQQAGVTTGGDAQKEIGKTGGLAGPLPDDRDIRPWEDRVRQALKDGKIDDAPDLKDHLIRGLAWAIRNQDCENIARGIFGTQIAALKEMNASGPLTQTALQTLYAEHETRVWGEAKGEPLPFLSWVGFLRDKGLATMDPDGRYQITNFGRFFVQFIGTIGLTEARQF